MKRLTILYVLLLSGVARPPVAMSIAPVAFPFGHSTVTPYVVADGNGFDVSWVDGKTFNFLGDNSAVVTWIEVSSTIVARRVAESGALDRVPIVGTSKAAIGFPRIAISNDNILAAWNGDDGVHLAIINPRIR